MHALRHQEEYFKEQNLSMEVAKDSENQDADLKKPPQKKDPKQEVGSPLETDHVMFTQKD